ncbi:biotin-dependent carboxyltransferase family protein [Xenorhabdus stockiae]|uniref:5-oxoprolinase subunit C family protein n=1 Tax=Xenorhabdus stockiae TaxID=351614 RepID=UPI003CF94FAD
MSIEVLYGIKVLKPGLSSSVQDAGREGYYHVGIPPSGTLDRFGLAVANLLVGNEPDTAGLECTLMGPELLFEQDTVFAVSGAPMGIQLDGQSVPLNTCLLAQQGQQLKITGSSLGARSYLAIAGGIDVPLVLGSRSTYSLGSLGGYQGRRLQAGDTLPVTAHCGQGPVGHHLPEEFKPEFHKNAELRVVPGMYIHRLTAESVDSFFSDEWRISSESDRIGYRFLDGRPLNFVERTPPFGAGSDPSNIVDACYPIGSIQIPSGRTPIVLHRDAVSGGGYMTLGTVVSSDLDILGQLPPGAKVKFTQVTLQQALAIRHTFQEKLQRLVTALS